MKEAVREVLHTEETKRVIADTLKTTMDAEDRRRVLKAAINDWLEDKYAHVGRWTLAGFGALAVAGLIYLALWERGWKPPH